MALWLTDLVLVVSLAFEFQVVHGRNHMGKSFLLQFPHLPWKVDRNAGVTLFFSTYSTTPVKVKIDIPDYLNEEGIRELLKRTVDITCEPGTVTKYDIPIQYMQHYFLNDISTPQFNITADTDFSLSVLMRSSINSMGSFLAYPVENFGYNMNLASLNFTWSIITLNNRQINVQISIPRANQTDMAIVEGFENRRLKNVFKTSERWAAQSIGGADMVITCLQPDKDFGNITGAVAWRRALDHAGIIVANCVGKTDMVMCDNVNKMSTQTPNGDISAEMFFPVEYHGYDYITVETRARVSPGIVIVQAHEPGAVVSVYRLNDDVNIFTLKENTDVIYLDSRPGPRRIRCKVPIQVTYIQRSPCEGSKPELGDGAITLLVPTANFIRDYYWGTPEPYEIKNYVIMVVPWSLRHQLSLNNELLNADKIKWTRAIGMRTWFVGEHKVEQRVNHLVLNVENKYFGCYVYGVGPDVAYMQYVGYETRECKPTSTTEIGDGLDNDCDNEIDEELPNQLDDDLDGKVDEDCRVDTSVDGSWGEWGPWFCSCATSLQTKKRKCNNPAPNEEGYPCDGPDTDSTEETCTCDESQAATATIFTAVAPDGTQAPTQQPDSQLTTAATKAVEQKPLPPIPDEPVPVPAPPLIMFPNGSEVTPSEEGSKCAPFTWGDNCLNHCPQCEDPCDQVTGSCPKCKSGFKNPGEYCSTACDVFEYGVNCAGSCHKKCGQDVDCVNRDTGECPAEQGRMLYVILAILAILFFAALTYYVLTKPAPPPVVEDVVEQAPVREEPEDRDMDESIYSLGKYGTSVDNSKRADVD